MPLRDLVGRDAVQANPFLIFDNDDAALIDPGGDLGAMRCPAEEIDIPARRLDEVLPYMGVPPPL